MDHALKKFNAIDENWKLGRFTFDIECDEVMTMRKKYVVHDDAGAYHEYSCQEKLWKRRETECSKAFMSNIDRSISFYTTNGSQNNELKFAVHSAVKNDNVSKNYLARKHDQIVEVKIGILAYVTKNFKQSNNSSIVLSSH